MQRFKLLLLIAGALWLTACGGGSSTTAPADTNNELVKPQRAPMAVNGEGSVNAGQPAGGAGGSIGLPGSGATVGGSTGTGTGTPGRGASLAGPRFSNRQTAVKKGLDYYTGNRATFTVSGFGVFPDVYEWYVGDGIAFRNIPGEVAALTLLSASKLPSNKDRNAYSAEGLATVDNFIIPVLTPAGQRPYAYDIGALLAAYEHTGDSDYLDYAVTFALRSVDSNVDGNPADGRTGAEQADFMINNRKSLSGWDSGPYFWIWHAVGAEAGGVDGAALQQWALDGLNQMWARKADWENTFYAGVWDYTHLSYGLLLESYSRVDAAGFSAQRDYLRGKILAQQGADGNWFVGWTANPFEWDDTQATYSCLLGLDADSQGGTVQARKKGEDYLRSKDLQATSGAFGGFAGDTAYNNEICAEATIGLAIGLNRGGVNN